MKYHWLSAVLGISMMIAVTGCTFPGAEGTEECESTPMQYKIDEVADTEYDVDQIQQGYSDYAIHLFQACSQKADETTNVMVSPTSVMLAMEMLDAGANGDTEKQITEMICPGAQGQDVQAFAVDLSEKLQESEDVEMNIANSAWINQDVLGGNINNDYVSYLEQSFGALATTLPFNDDAKTQMNQWVDENTNGMISQIIDNLPPEEAMVLINAIAFEGDWETPYEEDQITEETFTNANGSTTDATMLNGSAELYYETEDATGFIQYYAGRDYAFVAILPQGEESANEYASSMTGESFEEFLNSAEANCVVYTKIPEFTNEYEIALKNILMEEMGMVDAFDPTNADFTNIAKLEDDNLYVSAVIHKTFIELDRNGTRAAAVTAVYLETCGVAAEVDIKEVYLDRPFVYAIIDTQTQTPVFIGTVNEL